MKKITRQQHRQIRHRRVRAKILQNAGIPRLTVFRSNKHFYAQLVDDEHGAVIGAVSDKEIKKQKGDRVSVAKEIGKMIAAKAKEKKIEKIVFDRGGYKYHGNVKALAEGAREGGLVF
ncbi:MAG: 50S ribosomal protein L18 [Candidatus Wildermuthbacteria bacterium]|nr:50S ribosomal protein L18 [Candidatus Wildermuthbacteria bacterium]